MNNEKYTYVKKALTFDQQLQLLKERNLIVEDDEQALLILEYTNYYRLRAYSFPYQGEGESFREGVTFRDIISDYEFDQSLRNLVFEGVELFEVQLRTIVAYTIALRYGAFGHEDRSNFENSFWEKHAGVISRLREETERSKAVFVLHHKEKYAEFPKLPVWVATEVMTFGTLSKLFGCFRRSDQEEVAKRWDVDVDSLASWTHALAVARNICAHYGRLWNDLTIKPRVLKKDKKIGIGNKGVYYLIYALRRLVLRNPLSHNWTEKMFDFLSSMGSQRMQKMNIPKNWKEHPLWKNQHKRNTSGRLLGKQRAG